MQAIQGRLLTLLKDDPAVDRIYNNYRDTNEHKHFICLSSYDGFRQVWILRQKIGCKAIRAISVIHEPCPYAGDNHWRSNPTGQSFRDIKQAEGQIPGCIRPLWD